MPKITLFGNYYDHQDQARTDELRYVLGRNLSNEFINHVVLIRQNITDQFNHPKISWVDLDCNTNKHNRPTFRNYFDIVSQFKTDIAVIANSDIFFDRTLGLLRTTADTVLALSRYNLQAYGIRPNLPDYDPEKPGDCPISPRGQDTWIFLGGMRFPIKNCSFSMGVYCCDWRIAYEIRNAGYHIYNPCLDIKTYHLHRHHKQTKNHGGMLTGKQLHLTHSHLDDPDNHG